MSTTETLPDVMPSAIPSEAEIAAWDALPQEEQLRRLRASFAEAECSRSVPDTVEDILKEARAAAGLGRG